MTETDLYGKGAIEAECPRCGQIEKRLLPTFVWRDANIQQRMTHKLLGMNQPILSRICQFKLSSARQKSRYRNELQMASTNPGPRRNELCRHDLSLITRPNNDKRRCLRDNGYGCVSAMGNRLSMYVFAKGFPRSGPS